MYACQLEEISRRFEVEKLEQIINIQNSILEEQTQYSEIISMYCSLLYNWLNMYSHGYNDRDDEGEDCDVSRGIADEPVYTTDNNFDNKYRNNNNSNNKNNSSNNKNSSSNNNNASNNKNNTNNHNNNNGDNNNKNSNDNNKNTYSNEYSRDNDDNFSQYLSPKILKEEPPQPNRIFLDRMELDGSMSSPTSEITFLHEATLGTSYKHGFRVLFEKIRSLKRKVEDVKFEMIVISRITEGYR